MRKGVAAVGAEAFTNLDFADDDVLLEDTRLVLVRMMIRMETETRNLGVNINQQKTGIMANSKNEEGGHSEDIAVKEKAEISGDIRIFGEFNDIR